MWYARTRDDITDIDGTDAILAMHQGVGGGWKTIRKSVKYNNQIIKDNTVESKSKSETNAYQVVTGRTECMTYKLSHKRSPYLHLYKRTIVTRKPGKVDCPHYCCTTKYEIMKKDGIVEE